MQNSAVYYLNQVLGVSSWIRPIEAKLLPPKQVLVISPCPMNETEKEMVFRMLNAIDIKINQITFGDFEDEDRIKTLVVSDSDQISGVISYGASLLDDLTMPAVELASISQFLNPQNKGIQETKRQAWNKLKEFKNQVFNK